MATDKHKKEKDPNTTAHDEAEKDMEKDPELSDPDPTDDLDEGELANRDNSDEEAFDSLERPRHTGERPGGKGHEDQADKGHGGHGGHSGKGGGK